MLKAIETIYNGYKFRSRLEARWAVFFDEFNVQYEYEDEGFYLNENKTEKYLPDFKMKEWNCFVEIKPELPKFYDMEHKRIIEKEEYRKCQKLAQLSNIPVLLIGDQPWADDEGVGRFDFSYEIAIFTSKPISNRKSKDKNYLKILDNFHDKDFYGKKIELYHIQKGSYFDKENPNSLINFLNRMYDENPGLFDGPIPKNPTINDLIEIDKAYYQKKYNLPNPHWVYGIAESGFNFIVKNRILKLTDNFHARDNQNEKLIAAYTKARQARFEKFS